MRSTTWAPSSRRRRATSGPVSSTSRARIADRAHERVRTRCHRPDRPARGELVHAVERERDVHVAVERGVVEADARVALQDVGGARARRDHAERRVPALGIADEGGSPRRCRPAVVTRASVARGRAGGGVQGTPGASRHGKDSSTLRTISLSVSSSACVSPRRRASARPLAAEGVRRAALRPDHEPARDRTDMDTIDAFPGARTSEMNPGRPGTASPWNVWRARSICTTRGLRGTPLMIPVRAPPVGRNHGRSARGRFDRPQARPLDCGRSRGVSSGPEPFMPAPAGGRPTTCTSCDGTLTEAGGTARGADPGPPGPDAVEPARERPRSRPESVRSTDVTRTADLQRLLAGIASTAARCVRPTTPSCTWSRASSCGSWPTTAASSR